VFYTTFDILELKFVIATPFVEEEGGKELQLGPIRHIIPSHPIRGVDDELSFLALLPFALFVTSASSSTSIVVTPSLSSQATVHLAGTRNNADELAVRVPIRRQIGGKPEVRGPEVTTYLQRIYKRFGRYSMRE